MTKKLFVNLLANLMVFYPFFCSMSYAAINNTEVIAANENLSSNSPVQEVPESQKAQVQETYGKLPLYFTKNDGQMDKRVQFYEKGSGHSTFFTREGVYMSFLGETPRLSGEEPKVGWATPTATKSKVLSSDQKSTKPTPQSETIKLIPLNANKTPEIFAEGLQEGKVNYFVGNDSKKWKTNIATYKAVVYKELYKDIDMKFYGNNSQLEYDIVVKPGADPSKVKLSYEGIKGLKVTENGELEISLKEGKLLQKKPYVYQEIAGKRIEVEGRFKILYSPKISHSQFAYGFEVAPYNKSLPLIIDPVLVYSTYLGGSGYDPSSGVAIDIFGDVYITGYTTSIDFPVTGGAYQTALAGLRGRWDYHSDVFVTKLNANGTALIYSTYLGGSRSDQALGIAVDASGNAYLTGGTVSLDFPTTSGAFQATPSGPLGQDYDGWYGNDAFVTKLSVDGSALVYSTYLGGSNGDTCYAIAVDGAGNAYVTGSTSSRNFPMMQPFQATNRSWTSYRDAFVSKLNSNGSALIYSTYLGGNREEAARGIAVDDFGSAYVMGYTSSGNFPTAKPIQATLKGGQDIFVTKFDVSGTTLVYSTYFGGSGAEGYGGITIGSIAVDKLGNAYVTGLTVSTDFPTVKAFQSTLGGHYDGFVTKFNADGSSVVYSTYLGGSSTDYCHGITVDATGNAYVAGTTGSPDFPTVQPLQAAGKGSYDAFVSKFNIDGSALVYSTYLGGTGYEYIWGKSIAVDTYGNTYLTGLTSSIDFPTTEGAFQTVLAGASNAFIVKISDMAVLSVPSLLTASDTPCDNGGSVNLTWTLSSDDGSKVTGYRVYRSTTSGGPYDLIGSVNAGVNNYTDATATTGVTYYYVVRATDGTNESSNSNEASAVSARNLPLPPSSVTATDTLYDLGGSISLSWTKSMDDGIGLNNVLSYNIYRYSSTNGNIVSLASAQAGNVSYVDATTADTDTYYYFLTAMDKNCSIESSASSIASGQSVNNLTSLPGFISTLPGIAPELVNSLTSKVENAIASFDRGNETAAINQLNALLSEIAAQTGNKIEVGTAEILTNYVQNLINYIKSN